MVKEKGNGDEKPGDELIARVSELIYQVLESRCSCGSQKKFRYCCYESTERMLEQRKGVVPPYRVGEDADMVRKLRALGYE